LQGLTGVLLLASLFVLAPFWLAVIWGAKGLADCLKLTGPALQIGRADLLLWLPIHLLWFPLNVLIQGTFFLLPGKVVWKGRDYLS
jgi:hypothetical protein